MIIPSRVEHYYRCSHSEEDIAIWTQVFVLKAEYFDMNEIVYVEMHHHRARTHRSIILEQ